MAIPFLNNISLNNNEIQNVKLHNTANILDPSEGHIYFDTDDNIAKYWNGTGWVELVASTGGTVTSVTPGNINTITVGGTATDPTISANTAAVANGSLNLATGDQIYDFVIGQGYVESVGSNNSTFVNLVDSGTATDPNLTASLSATGTPSSSTFLRGDNTWEATPNDNTTYTLPVAAGGDNTAVINLTAGGSGSGVASSVTFSGTTNEVEVTETVGNNGTITIGLPNNVVIAETLTTGGNLTVNTTGVSNNLKLVSTDTTLAGAPDLVLFADAAAQNGDTLGSLLFQGKNGMVPSSTAPLTYAGFFAHMADASNNHSVLALAMHKGNGPGAQDTAMNFSLIGDNNSAEGALYINPPSSYAFPSYNLEVNGTSRFAGNATFNSNVTVDGNLTVTGTVTTLNETVKVVENNTIEFEGVTDNEFEIKLTGGDPTADRIVALPDASGTVALTSDLHSAVTLAGSYDYITLSGQQLTLNQIDYTTDIANTPTIPTNSDSTYAATISDSVSGLTFNHGLGDDVIVQLYDTVTKETVYADVDRNGNYLNITFAATPTNPIRVLVQKIG